MITTEEMKAFIFFVKYVNYKAKDRVDQDWI